MKPITFKGQNTVFAKDQPEYFPLPAFKTEDGRVVSCWKLSILERLYLLLRGRLWFQSKTFNRPLQPQLLTVNTPIALKKTESGHFYCVFK
jgi:hypothetical protein